MNKNLSADEFLSMARGDDPTKMPILNGPPHITTPPALPQRPMAHDGQLFEYFFPFPINIFSNDDWPIIRLDLPEIEIHVAKPITVPAVISNKFAVGNESPDLFITNFRVIVLKGARGSPANYYRIAEHIQKAIRWIRIMTRQYWIGIGSLGVAAYLRGSAFWTDASLVQQVNFASYGFSVIARVLRLDDWEFLPSLMRCEVPLAESLFCDALYSYVSRDVVSCLIELGVAAEIEVTRLCDELATVNSSSPEAKKYVADRPRFRFEEKFTDISVKLGADSPGNFGQVGFPQKWPDNVTQLYRFRNKAAHEGQSLVTDKQGKPRPLQPNELEGFVFSLEALFAWARAQRRKHAINIPQGLDRETNRVQSIIAGEESGGFHLDAGSNEALRRFSAAK